MDVEEIVAAAEAAIAAAEEAIVAAEEAASGEGVADIAERVKALRGKRASEEETTAETEEEEPTDEERKEVEAVRSIAKSYGCASARTSTTIPRAIPKTALTPNTTTRSASVRALPTTPRMCSSPAPRYGDGIAQRSRSAARTSSTE